MQVFLQHTHCTNEINEHRKLSLIMAVLLLSTKRCDIEKNPVSVRASSIFDDDWVLTYFT